MFSIKRLLSFSLLAFLVTICVGCIPFRTAPEVSGVVIDKNTKQPITQAKLYYKYNPTKITQTSRDGIFFVPANYIWLPLLPWDNFGGFLTVEAPHYHSTEIWIPNGSNKTKYKTIYLYPLKQN